MSRNIETKKQKVAELVEKIKSSASTLAVDYSGLTVEEITSLRRLLREENIEMKIIKNNLISRALNEISQEEMSNLLFGPTALLLSENDSTASARISYNYSKKHSKLELKSAIVEGSFVEHDEIIELAKLPNREGMYSMLLSVFQAPMRNLAYSLSEVAKQK